MLVRTVSPGLKSACISIALAFAHCALAQDFPNRPVTLIYPFAAGTPSDAAYRALTEETSRVLGQPVLMEIRPGAGGRLGVAAVMRAPADGYLTSIAIDGILAVQAQASATFKAEPGKDYEPVLLTTENYVVMTAHPSVPFRDLNGLIAYAKANPGKLTFASTGIGASTHFNFERVISAAGIVLTHIPYKGEAQSMPDRLTGQVNLFMGAMNIKPYVDSGQLVAIATSGPQRSREFPNTPTLREAGLPDVTLQAWMGVIAPPRTPAATVAKLNAAFNTALKSPRMRKVMEGAGFIVVGTTPDEFSARIRSDTAVYAPIIRRIGLKLD